MEGCVACGPLEGELWQSRHWRAVLNRNQNLLGKTMLVLRRHLVRVADLTAEEWADLHGQLGEVTRRLDAAFAPDHYNYAFLQNADRHVHLHVIPRYASARELAGASFGDPDYPGHYAVPMPDRRLPCRRRSSRPWAPDLSPSRGARDPRLRLARLEPRGLHRMARRART